MYYERRKCSQNVYFLERSRYRSSYPVLKELPLDGLRVWNTSIDKLPEDKNCSSSSLATLRISATTGYDWRRDRNQTSCDYVASPRGLQLTRRNNLKLQQNSQENSENQQPFAISNVLILSEYPLSKPLTVEEENVRLRESLSKASYYCRGLQSYLAKAGRRYKDLEEQLKQKIRRIDELERDKWLTNFKVCELEKNNQAMEEIYQSRVDPSELFALMKKIEVLETLQRQMYRYIRDDDYQWQRERTQYEEGIKKLR